MTIWSERTQRSIASGFAAASVSGNRTLRSVVPSGRRVPYGVVSVGRRIPYSVAAPMNTATPTPHRSINFCRKEQTSSHKAFTIDGAQLRSCLKNETFT